MKNTDIKLENLLNNLRQQQPQLHDAENVIDSIMTHIAQIPEKRKPKTLIWIRTISSVAAIFLLGLFISQQWNMEIEQSTSEPTTWTYCSTNIDSLCMQKLSDKHQNLVEAYYCHMQRNSEKNKIQKFIYQQIKD